MGLFDIFGTGDQTAAARDQITGLNNAYTLASGNINTGVGAINTNYADALKPFMENYGTATSGTTQLGKVLGLNGPAGNADVLKTLEATPGYQFQLQQGNNAINAQAAATGMNASGNQLLDLSKFNEGLAGTTYNNYVNSLLPFLGASNAAATGIAGVKTGQGNAVAGQQDLLAQLGYQTQTGIGNANANADLAGLTASGNIWNAIGSAGKTAASLAPMLMMSDERLKEDIENVGELFDGQPVYKYRYIGDPKWQIGLMAQDVEKTNPDAVVEIAGYKAVHYGKATQYAADLSRFLEAA